MKLDTKVLRHLTNEDWKVLAAVEQGSRHHELVPTAEIVKLSHLRSPSAVHKSISLLAKSKLIARIQNSAYDGYRLSYGGLDYLALHAHTKADTLYAVGNQIGIGKESDIFAVADASGKQYVLKIHRLGRISFRRVRNTRDYLRKRGRTRPSGGGSMWMHMSRLAALKEHTFMEALHEAGFPVPKPVAHNRHTVVMQLIDAFPLRKIAKVPDPAGLYAELMAIIVQLARRGLIHGDFNEFNILIREDSVEAPPEDAEASSSAVLQPSQTFRGQPSQISGVKLTPILIDFPQMVSISHENAKMYFDRDVKCIKDFFERRFGFIGDATGPTFEEATRKVTKRLDIHVEASGFSKKMAKDLEQYMAEVGVDGDRGMDTRNVDDDDEEEDDDDDVDEGDENAEEEMDEGQVGVKDEVLEPSTEADNPQRSSANRDGTQDSTVQIGSGQDEHSELHQGMATLQVDIRS